VPVGYRQEDGPASPLICFPEFREMVAGILFTPQAVAVIVRVGFECSFRVFVVMHRVPQDSMQHRFRGLRTKAIAD